MAPGVYGDRGDGRPERYRAVTYDWLERHDLRSVIDGLLMRPDGERMQDGELKLRLLDGYFGSRSRALRRVAFILEDRERVVTAYRGAGFRCWQVQPGAF